jgi:Flp pilus assembly protein TadG
MIIPRYFFGKSRQRGLAASEFVIVLPVVLLLLFATAELGRAFYQYNTLTKAVRNGARYLAEQATQGSTGVINITGAIAAATRNMVVYGNTAGGGEPLLESWSADKVTATVVDLAHIQVSATFTFQPLFGRIPTFGFGADIPLNFDFQSTVTMRAL